MPTYDYRCTANGQVIEISHGMHERLRTWGEVCARAGIAPGDIPAGSPVEKLITGTQVLRGLTDDLPSCGTGGCGGGMCGLG